MIGRRTTAPVLTFVGFVVLVNRANATSDCLRTLNFAEIRNCCKVPELNFNSYDTECKQLRPRQGQTSPCHVECILKAAGAIENDQLNVQNTRSMFNSLIVNGNREFVNLFTSSFDQCTPTAQRKFEAFKNRQGNRTRNTGVRGGTGTSTGNRISNSEKSGYDNEEDNDIATDSANSIDSGIETSNDISNSSGMDNEMNDGTAAGNANNVGNGTSSGNGRTSGNGNGVGNGRSNGRGQGNGRVNNNGSGNRNGQHRRRIGPNGERCSPLATFYAICANQKVFINCPASAWTASPICENARKRAIECENDAGARTRNRRPITRRRG